MAPNVDATAGTPKGWHDLDAVLAEEPVARLMATYLVGARSMRVQESAEKSSEFGQYLRGVRERRGMTQAQLADAVGIRYPTAIAAIEAGVHVIRPEQIERFAEALAVDPGALATMAQMATVI